MVFGVPAATAQCSSLGSALVRSRSSACLASSGRWSGDLHPHEASRETNNTCMCAVLARGRCAEDSRGRYEWVQLEELGGCTELLARFVLRLKAERLLPLPGDVFCLVAGPPCQHITGLNHKANNIKVMKDSTNRIVLSVLRIVEHLRPPFTLLEQVRCGPWCMLPAQLAVPRMGKSYLRISYFKGGTAPPHAECGKACRVSGAPARCRKLLGSFALP